MMKMEFTNTLVRQDFYKHFIGGGAIFSRPMMLLYIDLSPLDGNKDYAGGLLVSYKKMGCCNSDLG